MAAKSLQPAREKIRKVICEELGRQVLITERAAIALEHLIYDRSYKSWQLKMLNSLFETTPLIYQQIVREIPIFGEFDYKKISSIVSASDWRTTELGTKSFRKIISQLLGEPNPRIKVIRMTEYTPKKDILGDLITVDHLVLLLFWNLYLGQWFSDLALGMITLDDRELHYGKVNRWYLDSFEGFVTNSEIVDYSYCDQQWIMFHDGKQVRVRPFGAWGINQFGEAPLPDGSLWIARGDVIQPPTRFAEDKIQRLEYLINNDALERDFQAFFETNPEFLLALGQYKGIHPQLVLHEDDGGPLIPDFFLERLSSDFCDIVDLKRANVRLSRNQKSRHRFRDTIMEGVAQLEHYRNWFEDRQHRNSFYAKFGLKAYRPRVVLIIGRRETIFDEIQRVRVQSLLPEHCDIHTYDDVVASARHYLSLIKAP
jgi:hypothetical protein